MSSRLVILGLTSALVAAPLPAAAQHCYLHMQQSHTQRVVGGVATQCRLVDFISSASAQPPTGFSNANVIYNLAGPACATRMATDALFRNQSGWSCYRQTFNGAIQAARPPGAW